MIVSTLDLFRRRTTNDIQNLCFITVFDIDSNTYVILNCHVYNMNGSYNMLSNKNVSYI